MDMAIKAKVKGGDYPVAPTGNHVARVYSIIHIGTIQEEYKGEVKDADKVRIGFELPMETMVFKEGEGARPFVISQEYTNSMGKKANLRAIVEGIIGTGLDTEEAEFFDVLKLMGETCMLNVVHKTSGTGSTYAKIQSAAPLPKGMTVPEAANMPFILDFEENWSEEKFNKLPEFLRNKIVSSKEYRALKGIAEPTPDEVMSADNPF